jgi:hypothetical protein
MKTQTAVQWLAEQFDNIVELYPNEWEKINNAIEQANAMFEEQIKSAFNNGMNNSVDYFDGVTDEDEQYYNETYKQDI